MPFSEAKFVPNAAMDQSELEARIQRLERRGRMATWGLVGCGMIAVLALGAALRALIPVLRVQNAFRTFATTLNQEKNLESTPSQAGSIPAAATEEALKLPRQKSYFRP